MFSRVREAICAVIEIVRGGPRLAEIGWVVERPGPLDDVLRRLHALLPAGSILYLDGVYAPTVQAYARAHEVTPQLAFPRGWSNVPRTFPHLPVDAAVLDGLAALCRNCSPHEVTNDLAAYCGGELLLTWNDLPNDPILLSPRLDANRVQAFQTP